MAQVSQPATRDLLVPVLDLSAGLPDPVAISTWHMALANLVGSELPHQLLALWLFPDRGGTILLGPDALAQDDLPVPEPAPHLTQDQLFELEDTLRRAKYASAVAVPVRTEDRDVGVLLIGTFEPGAYGATAARLLRQLAAKLAEPLRALGTIVTAPTEAVVAADAEELTAALVTLANDAPSGPELVRRLSGLLHPHVPHDRLEIITFSNGSRAAIPLSGQGSRRRWGAPSSTWGDVSKLLLEFAAEGPTAVIANLAAEAPGLSLPGAPHGRVGSVLGGKMMLGGDLLGLVIVGHAAHGLYRDRDEAALADAARAIAPRVAAFRYEAEAQALRGQLEVLQAPSLPILRAAESLAATAHLGEALHRVGAELKELLPHDSLAFQLRLGDDELVEFSADSLRPLADLPLTPLAEAPTRAVFEAGRAWTLIHRHETEGLAVALRVAGRVIGALIVQARHFEAPRDAAAVALQFASVLAPHLELLRRSGTASRTPARKQ
ncbi:MAG: GAF domain-containing protein [Gemmatimonadales bacterium]